MKPINCLFFTVVLIWVGACQKSTVAVKKTLIGEWKETATYYSTGGPATWVAVPANTDYYINFNGNNTVKSNVFPDFSRYTVADSVTITFTNSDDAIKNGKVKTQNYRYIISHDTLTMSPSSPPLCVEGCGVRFVKK